MVRPMADAWLPWTLERGVGNPEQRIATGSVTLSNSLVGCFTLPLDLEDRKGVGVIGLNGWELARGWYYIMRAIKPTPLQERSSKAGS